MTSKLLQKPKIIQILGGSIRIAHPDISGNIRAFLRSPLTAAGVTLAISDNRGFVDDDWFILGEVGDNEVEECDVDVDVNGAVTRGTVLTITNSTKFSHEIDCPITKIYERGIKIYGAENKDGIGELIISIDAITATTNQLADAIMIHWDKPYTEFTLASTDTTTTYAYYYATFTDGATDSSASDYILAGGLASNTAEAIYSEALRMTSANIQPSRDGKITREFLTQAAQDAQDEVVNFRDARGVPHDWPFEIVAGTLTSTEGENRYALSGLTYEMKYGFDRKSIIEKGLKLGTIPLTFKDKGDFDDLMKNKIKGYLTVEAIAGATTITLTAGETYEFADSGSVVVGVDTLTYTGKTDASNLLTGIPASGSGSITETHAVGSVVWQNITLGKPTYYTIFNEYLEVDTPIHSDFAGIRFKLNYLKKISTISEPTDVTEVPFYFIFKYFVAGRIEQQRKNETIADKYFAKFKELLEMQARVHSLPMTEPLTYFEFNTNEVLK